MAVVLITFSGPEGSGKTTHSHFVQDLVCSHGSKAKRIAFINLGLTTILINTGRRARLLRKKPRTLRVNATGETAAVCAADNSGKQRPPFAVGDVRRIFTYLVDAIIFRLYLALCRCSRIEVLVCDRYFYDALVRLARRDSLPARILRAIIPRPDLAFLLDIDPETGMDRRRTSDRSYYQLRIRQYHELLTDYPVLVLIESRDLKSTQDLISRHVGRKLRFAAS